MFFECPKTTDARSKYQPWISDVLGKIHNNFTLPICTITEDENILTQIRYAIPLPKAIFNYNNDQVRTFFTDGSSSVADIEIDREASWAIVEDLCQ